MKENIQVTRFSNGLTVLTEPMSDVRSATIGFWLRKGSRHEPTHLNGILHFIEHAVFKGTNRRSAFDIAVEIDRLGGNLDAFTTHDMTGFVAKVVDTEAANAFDLLVDMLTNPLFDEKEMRREQRVIIEEIKMVEDSPEEILGEIFTKGLFPNHPLGMPIEGTRRTVRTFNSKVTSDFHRAMYQPGNIVITCAGNVEHKRMVKMAEKAFKDLKSSRVANKSAKPEMAAPIILKRIQHLEQAHLLIGTPWIKSSDARRYAANILSVILGDGNSSRLWQTIRETHGLAYNVGASENTFTDCGAFTVYAACSPDKLPKVVDLTIAELGKIKTDGVTDAELQLAKDQIKASILLGLEDSGARATTLARQEIFFGKQISVEETLESLEKVTTRDVQSIAREFFKTDNMSLAALGNLDGIKIARKHLEV